MSGPFRFDQQQDSRSPLDRPLPNLFPTGQPPSFKTNVNRSKTKKWVEAKPYSYDGDDWGEVDEYDEYGADEPQPPPQSAAVASLRQPGSRVEQSSRSFTDPQHHQGFPQPARRNSFEAGEEYRAFSAGTHTPQKPYEQQSYAAPSQQTAREHPAHRQASATESDTSDTPQHRRDFLPAALPPPLQTKITPGPGSPSGSPLNPKYPIRKSSIGQMDSPGVMSPRERAPSNPTKPLPFIRPADIYRRAEEERQRERTASMDSSRPSLDSLSSRPRGDATSPPPSGAEKLRKTADPAKSLHNLETVAERKSEYSPGYKVPAPGQQPYSQSEDKYQPPLLPQVRPISAFDNVFWSANQQPQTDNSLAPVTSAADDQGFRTAVDQAFTRTDDQRSVPPTPISKSDSGVSRSNTDSTSGISPIMSRVPSSATSALRNRNNAGGDGSTPMIAEEAGEGSTPVPQATSMLGGPQTIVRKPSPTSHARDFSSSSLPRSSLVTPSPGDSPAHTPAIEPQSFAPESESVLYSTLSPTSSETMEGKPASNLATREADIASAIKLSPITAVPDLGAAEKMSQDAFLASHQSPDSPLSDVAPRSRSESPSKGRVQELAGKFGDVSHSRRGSTQSSHSVQSWERSPENSRSSSPTKTSTSRPISPTKQILGERPAAAREASFRPKLPGQWESYTTMQPTPSDQGDRDMQLSGDAGLTPENHQILSPLDEVDLTPTTAKHSVLATDPSNPLSSPSEAFAALKAAGTAMGEALQTSVGLGSSSTQPSQDREGEVRGQSYGDMYLSRPLQLDRTISSNSSMPPTPPAKESLEFEDFPPPPPLKEKSPEPFASSSQQQTPVRPTFIPQLSTDTTIHDLESDRLRKEIVASLTPLKTSDVDHSEPSLQPTVPPETNRASSILPSEYDSYWADGDQVSPRPPDDLGYNVSQHPRTSTDASPVAPRSTATELSDPNKHPALNHNYSWESDQPPHVLSERQEQGGTDAQATWSSQENKEVATPAAVNKSYPVDESDVTVRSPTPPPKSEKPSTSPTRADTVKEVPHPTGLHVVNTETDPEAVDMPPRLSARTSPTSQPSLASPEESSVSRQQLESHEATTAAPVPGSATVSSATQDHVAKSPTSDKPLGFRDIVTMKTPSERIATYNKTRDYWAKTDHGLNDWIASAVAANPQLESLALQHRPPIAATATSRHKTTGSLSLFGKKEGASNTQASTATYLDQYNSGAAQVPSTPTSSGAPGEVRPQGFSAGTSGGRSASHQMQTKGKDLLHTAGVLGGKGLGKGMTSAKGLFAKGKSRFRATGGSSDKGSRPTSMYSSSREASEEPEFVTSTPERRSRMSMDVGSPQEEKKKRRMSLSFHRSSRSRSRPSSIVLPKNTHFDSGSVATPRNTPPHETPPVEDSRPLSFHAPDSWNITSASHQYQQPASYSTPPREGGLQQPERLGVLPSPAKSAFSFLAQDRDDEIPPVPPIPDGIEEKQRGQAKQESARQHRVIRSIVRYSTPPAMDLETSRHMDEATVKDASARPAEKTVVLQPSPMLNDAPAATKAVQLDAPIQQNNLKMLPLNPMKAGDLAPHMNQRLPPRSVPELEHTEEDDDDLPPILQYEPPQPFHQAVEISPPLGPSIPEADDLSPVASSVGLDDMDEIDRLPQLDAGSSMRSRQHTNVDPNEASSQRREYKPEEIGKGDEARVSSRTQNMDKAAPTNKTMDDALLDRPSSRQTGRVPAKVGVDDDAFPAPDATVFSGETPLHSANATSGTTHHRLSASPHPVLHAIQHVPSRSSLGSWEQASVVAPSQSEGSRLDDKYNASEISPVPLIPTKVQEDHKTPHQHPRPGLPIFHFATSNNPIKEQLLVSEPSPQENSSSFKAETAISGSHEQSQSLLSTISSLVPGDGLSISPASSQAGRSRSPSANRQSLEASAKSSPAPLQILEGSTSGQQLTMAVPISNDYDLYADQNGIVKDVHDEMGHPLQVAAVPVADMPKTKQKPVLGAARMTAMSKPPKMREENKRRYSDERPMSFVSGPRDAHGMPQDEISTRGSEAEVNIPPMPQIPSHQLQGNPQVKPDNTTYSSTLPLQAETRSIDTHQQQYPAIGIVRRDTVSPVHSSLRSEQIHTIPHSNVSPPPPSNASPPPQPSPLPALSQRPLLHEIMMQSPIEFPPLQDSRFQSPSSYDSRLQSPPLHDPRFQSPHMHDPRLQSPPLHDSRMQSRAAQNPETHDPRLQSLPALDPTMQGRPLQNPRPPQEPQSLDPRLMAGAASGQSIPLDSEIQAQNPRQTCNTPSRMGMPRLGGQPPSAPRNQYELQEQQMQRQVVDLHQVNDPRLRNAEYELPGVGPSQNSVHPTKHEEKGSSRPKFASVLKSLGGKSSSSVSQASQQPNTRIDPSLSVPAVPIRNASYQSSIGDLPTEQVAVKKERRTSVFGSLTSRPKSVGTESHVSHVSQDSARVQAANSRLDSEYPASPAPYKDIPPHQVPQDASLPPQQSQAQHVSTPSVPETGKKKRFSSLGNFFIRSGMSSNSASTKVKLSKEEKKLQKAQRNSSMPQFQPPPPSQQWPQQYNMQYGPSSVAATRPFPGMQGITLSPQNLSATSPQRSHHTQSMPPHDMRPQSYQQQLGQPGSPQHFPPQNQMQPQQLVTNGSAYLSTRHISQTHQLQRPMPQASQSTQSVRPVPASDSSFEHTMQRSETMGHAPISGYYQPDSKRADIEHGPGFAATQPQHQHPPQPQRLSINPQTPANQRIVSSPSPTLVPQTITPVSQRRVSSPSAEPQYDTPQIPAAYNHVTGVYTSPTTQPPNYYVEPDRPSLSQRQYSDPNMPSISPQVSAPQDGTSSRQYSDASMHQISPQVSARSIMPNERTPSNSSVASVVSPISNPSPAINQRPQKPRMTSITEATHQERPWNLNVREGATEQEIVRARHHQFMEQKLAEQLHAERTGKSPSPHSSHQSQSPSPRPTPSQQPYQEPPLDVARVEGGFREVLPKSSTHPMSQTQHHTASEQQHFHQVGPGYILPDQGIQPAAYPLPTSPMSAGTRSPANPLAGSLPPPPPPPPKIPHSPMRPAFTANQFPGQSNPQHHVEQQSEPPYDPRYHEQHLHHHYEEQAPDEPPPSYSGPGISNEGMNKERPHLPNIMTDAEVQTRQSRQRQPSLGLLQHPQPASMAASPQRSSADMGAANLRQQLLEQEERARAERLYRAEMQRVETERERQERERARARARELERSVSGGGRVGSLSVVGSRRGGSGWERGGSTSRPVFELPAVEDDEPVMRATSFPGQEWVPQWTED